MAQISFDRRRINGPEESFSPIYEDDVEENTPNLDNETRRGRGPSDIRPICTHLCFVKVSKLITLNNLDIYIVLKTGLISQANGSAYIETEKTKIACAVSVSNMYITRAAP